MAPTYKQLSAKHAGYSAEKWKEAFALYAGGDEFARNVKCFLPQNPFEPMDMYSDRLKLAANTYENHIGNIISTTENQLFTQGFSVRAKDKSESDLDPYWARFKEDCDGKGLDLSNFIRARFVEAMIYGQAGWLLELPQSDAPALNQAEWRERGLGEGLLTPVSIFDVWNYGHDDDGNLTFLTIHTSQEVQAGPFSPSETVETWRVYTPTNVDVYRIRYADRAPGANVDVPKIWSGPHKFPTIPYVQLSLPASLSLMERGGTLQRKVFDMSFGLFYALKRTNYPVPIFKTKEPLKVDRSMGYALSIGQGDDFSWMMPPAEGFSVQLAAIEAATQELYRVCGALVLAADTNSASADRRSGKSRETEISMSEVALNRYGAILRQAIEDIYSLMSAARSEATGWDVSGFDRYALQVQGTSLEDAVTALSLDIGSETFAKELKVFITEKILPSLPQTSKSEIRAEIEKGQPAAPEQSEKLDSQSPVDDSNGSGVMEPNEGESE